MAEDDSNASTKEAQVHHALMLDEDIDALLARIELIRSARSSIELQTYIFAEDDIGQLFMSELLAAARRGVRVRLLVDQLSAFEQVGTIATLATSEPNLALRLYNPTMGRGRPRPWQSIASLLCCFRKTNRRMHEKMLVVDSMAVVTGGRNFQNDYFGWSQTHNFRDRDIIVTGPVAIAASTNFDRMWESPESAPAIELKDIRRWLRTPGNRAPSLHYAFPRRVDAIEVALRDASDVRARLVEPALSVGSVRLLSDGPGKHDADVGLEAIRGLPQRWLQLMGTARREVLLETPYLVLSEETRDWMNAGMVSGATPVIKVVTNSLASSDSSLVYAATRRLHNEYIDRFGLQIHEYRPRPSGTLEGDGNKRMLHAKAMVVDRRLAVIGSHNLDARSDHYNIEGMLIVDDAAFAETLAHSIETDMSPENAWLLRRVSVKGRGGRGRAMLYACAVSPEPVATEDVIDCGRDAGEFPQASRSQRWRAHIYAAFGQWLAPLL